MKGIDKGDIISSGAPQVSKDGSVGRNSVDFTPSRRTKHGSHFCERYITVYLCIYLGRKLMCIVIGLSEQTVKKIYHLLLKIIKMKVLTIQRVVM